MIIYHPDLSTVINEIKAVGPAAAIRFGESLALTDYEAEPSNNAYYYATMAISYVNATIAPARSIALTKAMANHPRFGHSPVLAQFFADHKIGLEQDRVKLDLAKYDWVTCLEGVGIGMAQVADQLFDTGEFRRFALPPFVETFVLDFVTSYPARGACSQIGRGGYGDAGGVAEATTVTTAELISAWLNSKGALSRSERSRQGSSAKLFIDAMGLTEAPADRLVTIGEDAAERFFDFAVRAPLKPRGERARVMHIANFLDYARNMFSAVPKLDWSCAQDLNREL